MIPTSKRLVGLAVLMGGLGGCATAGTRGPEGAAPDGFADPATRAGVPLVLIAMPPSANFRTSAAA